MKNNPADLPYSVCGGAWRELQKGERISAEKVEEMYFLLTDKKLITASRDQNRDLSFRSLQVKQWIESNRVEIGKPLVLRQDKGSLVILTDAQAVDYLNGQAYQGLTKHRRNTRKMFNRIDVENLGQYDRDQLSVNQGRHSFIAAAIDGAKKQLLRIQKDGGTIPKIKPPDED